MDDKTVNLTAGHEDFRQMPYLCTEGHLTVGYGYNLDANPLKLSPEKIKELLKYGIGEAEAEQLMRQLLEQVEHELSGKLLWWSKLNLARQSVLLDMAYNMGVNGLMKFNKMLAAIGRGDYQAASGEMLNSKWARQVKTRANKLVSIMQTGKLT